MSRFTAAAGLIAALALGSSALAQGAPPGPGPALGPGADLDLPPITPPPSGDVGVGVTRLAAPDLFSTAGRATGLPSDLWRGASPATLRTVLPQLASKPLTPAAAGLARRVLATGASAPKGVGDDPVMAGARVNGLVALGDMEAAQAILSRTTGVERDAGLSRAAAEAALTAGDDARACQVGDALLVGRDDIYWLRLRAYCQVLAGQTAAAQLTFQLAQSQAADPVYGRLMGAKIAGFGDPGQPSERNGLERALSRSLGLPVSPPPPPPLDLPRGQMEQTLSGMLGERSVPDAVSLEKLIGRASQAPDGRARERLQATALLVAALGADASPEARGALATYSAEAKAPTGRAFALNYAADHKLMGEAAALSLWTCLDAGQTGPALGDRVAIVAALHAVGLDIDADAFAAEGLASLP